MAPNPPRGSGAGGAASGANIAAASLAFAAFGAAAVGSYVAAIRRPDESLPQTAARVASSALSSASSWIWRSLANVDNAAVAARLRRISPTLSDFKMLLSGSDDSAGDSSESKTALFQEFLMRMGKAGLAKPNVRRRVWPIVLGVLRLDECQDMSAKIGLLRRRLEDLEGFADVPSPDGQLEEGGSLSPSKREWAAAIENAEGMEAPRKRWATRVARLLAAAAVADPEIGYAQGMSDILAPLLALFDGQNGESSQVQIKRNDSKKEPRLQNIEDEDALAFACFEALLQSQGLRNGFLIPADVDHASSETSTLSEAEAAAAYAANLGVSPWLCTAFEATERILETRDSELATHLFSNPREDGISNNLNFARPGEDDNGDGDTTNKEPYPHQRPQAERLMTYRSHLLWAAREIENPADVPVLWDAILASRIVFTGFIPDNYLKKHALMDLEEAKRDMVNHVVAATLRLKKNAFLTATGSDDVVAVALFPLRCNAYTILEMAWDSVRQFNSTL